MSALQNPATETTADELLALGTAMRGRVVTPADTAWDEARLAWNLAVDQRPFAVALPESAEDVQTVVSFAAERGLRVAPQSTGHNAHPLENRLARTILLKTSAMRGVQIDPERRIARVEGGTLWGDVIGPAAAHGLAALAGSTHDVAVVGYTLGGGLSWLARRHGLAANHVVAIELVTADGELVRTDHENRPDLFWALRGGGGNFGVVTAMEFELFPITHVYAGAMFFPQDRAREVLHTWRELTQRADLPDEFTSVGRILNVPPLPEIPEFLRGRSFVVVEGIYIGEEADGAELVASLRDLGPEIDTFGVVPVEALIHLHMDPPGPVPGKGDGMLLTEAPADAVDAFIDAATGEGIVLTSAELRHAGGALGRTEPGHGAVGALGGEYVMFAVGAVPVPQLAEPVKAQVAGMKKALAPWESDHVYGNFAEKAIDARRLYADDYTYRRIQAVKAQCDPHNVFQANHAIEAR
jgi:UDP-N-acetylenolpyruvoylglucosamine reductase